ncbi:TetR/AcrR family transcriptional regulator [Actinomadura algeriensis]|uniref:AcrR family transcriptional regulator n=1 Tax=Actinomadura algeriensis TaxID=1679523 RepID=A0ABR9JTX5_9ACTN|nr:TetR/AcrR family transcriptional regulator [Actinomadura algeriensis]MBE1534019.1 AcrR family transcriptional regulator [Actinomadura algeriensis]
MGHGDRGDPAREAPSRAAGEAAKLPSGRHRLSRDYVASNQRARILRAVTEIAGGRGYSQLTIDAIVGASAISKKTFYEHFRNKEEAFFAACESVASRMTAAFDDAAARRTEPDSRLRAGLGALLEFLAAEPLGARMALVEVLAAGPEAVARRDRVKQHFSTMVAEHLLAMYPDFPEPGLAAEVIVGGVHEVLYSRISRGEAHALPALRRGLVRMYAIPAPRGADH